MTTPKSSKSKPSEESSDQSSIESSAEKSDESESETDFQSATEVVQEAREEVEMTPVWARSAFKKRMDDGLLNIPTNGIFPYHIVGDDAFPLQNYETLSMEVVRI